jgi:transcriptional regulator with XRE-family HTH domain
VEVSSVEVSSLEVSSVENGRSFGRSGRVVFGALVRRHRRRLGLTQDELADKSGIGVRTIRDIEAGKIARPRPVTVRMLADALGLEDQERERFWPAAAAEPAEVRSPPRPVPAQLPAGLADFVGRTDQLDRLSATLGGSGNPPTTVVISAVAGAAGVGKTALAVHWAHSVASQFPGGQLYVNLRGFDPSGSVMSQGEALRGFLDAFGVPPDRMPVDLSARVGLYRSLLIGRRVLVVLDNARDAEQVRPLLPGAPGCTAIVTSRSDLSGLIATHAARHFMLDVLSAGEARQLLARRLGEGRVAAQVEATEEIIVRCGRLP